MKGLKIYLIILTVSCYSNLIHAETLQLREAFVEINQGALRGKISKTQDGKTFYEFLGIPYGKVRARFQISQLADGWKGVRNANDYAPPCIQINSRGQLSGVEDCLTISVFTPQLPFKNESRKLPVIFGIYSARFTEGDSRALRPEHLIDQDVILVTVNHRLGPMGFLNAGVATARGNQAFKDLTLALRWVKENIDKFGGDPERVVIQSYGSTGSYAVSYLTLSPMANDLFAGAISQGRTALCPLKRNFKTGVALRNAKKLANLVDCPSSNPSYLVKCLQRLEASVLLEQTLPADSFRFDKSHPEFGPSLETFHEFGTANDPNVFLDEDPLEILEKGTFNKVPYVLGVNYQESLITAARFLANDTLTEKVNKNWSKVAANTLIDENYVDDTCKATAKIREFYFGDKNISSDSIRQVANLFGDRWSNTCVRKTALLYAKHADTYLFNFTRTGASVYLGDDDSDFGLERVRSLLPSDPSDEGGYLSISDELIPIWANSPNFTNSQSDDIVSLWTSFAKTGIPSCNWCSNTEWPQFNPNASSLSWYQIDESPENKAEEPDFTKRMDFWESLLPPKVISVPRTEKITTTTEIITTSPTKSSDTDTTKSRNNNIDQQQNPDEITLKNETFQVNSIQNPTNDPNLTDDSKNPKLDYSTPTEIITTSSTTQSSITSSTSASSSSTRRPKNYQIFNDPSDEITPTNRTSPVIPVENLIKDNDTKLSELNVQPNRVAQNSTSVQNSTERNSQTISSSEEVNKNPQLQVPEYKIFNNTEDSIKNQTFEAVQNLTIENIPVSIMSLNISQYYKPYYTTKPITSTRNETNINNFKANNNYKSYFTNKTIIDTTRNEMENIPAVPLSSNVTTAQDISPYYKPYYKPINSTQNGTNGNNFKANDNYKSYFTTKTIIDNTKNNETKGCDCENKVNDTQRSSGAEHLRTNGIQRSEISSSENPNHANTFQNPIEPVKTLSLKSSNLQLEPHNNSKIRVSAHFRFNASVLLSILLPSMLNNTETYNISF